MAEIKARKHNLHELFNHERFFKIPEYQRPYSWQQEHCEQLFDDIVNSDWGNEYFLGTTIFKENGKVGTATKYDIIDGQQRITTLQILLACLRDIVVNPKYKTPLTNLILQPDDPVGGVPEIVRLDVKDKEKIFFKEFIQEENSTLTIDNYEPKNNAEQNIFSAIRIFKEMISKLSTDKIEGFIQHLSQRCIVIFVSTANFDDAYRLFTITNDRGLQLKRIDILKVQNIDPLLISDQAERVRYARIWEDMEDDLGRDEFEKLFFFIRMIEVKEKAKEDLLKEFENNIFKKGKLKKGKIFINHVKNYHSLYKELIIDKDSMKNFQNNSTFNNLLNVMLEHLKGNDWIPPLLCYYKKFGRDNIYEFLNALEKKYSYSWLTGKTKDKRLVDMCSIIKEIDSLSTADDVLKIETFQFDWFEFKTVIIAKDFYKKPFAKYILVKLEYLSSDNTMGRSFGISSIEHVLPQSPQADSDWNNDFSNEEIERWTHSIANLILLNKRRNSSASNLDFKDKKEKYFKNKITDLPRSLQILNVSKWTPEILINRENEIVNLLK